MLKLVAEEGRWATKNNDMIFCNVIWIGSRKEANKYHLIDENKEEISIRIEDCIENDPYYPEPEE